MDYTSPIDEEQLVAEVASSTFCFMNKIKGPAVQVLWDTLARFIVEALKQQKGVLLPSLGTFRVGPVVGETRKKIRPAFALLETRYSGVSQERTKYNVGQCVRAGGGGGVARGRDRPGRRRSAGAGLCKNGVCGEGGASGRPAPPGDDGIAACMMDPTVRRQLLLCCSEGLTSVMFSLGGGGQWGRGSNGICLRLSSHVDYWCCSLHVRGQTGGRCAIVQPNYGLLATAAAVHRGACQRLVAELLQRLGVHILSGRPLKVRLVCARLRACARAHTRATHACGTGCLCPQTCSPWLRDSAAVVMHGVGGDDRSSGACLRNPRTQWPAGGAAGVCACV